MVYSSEAILLTDIVFGVPHTQNYDQGEAETTRRTDLERACYEQQLRRYHDKNI